MRVLCCALIVTMLGAVPAAAQSNVEVNAGVQFDFLSPGARSMAMGSAFIGMADDATASFTNPAGLRALTRREVSFEARGRNFDVPVAARGRFGGTPTNRGIDTLVGTIEDQSQNAAGLSFLSFVYPSARWAVSGYRHELSNLDVNIETQGPFFGEPNTAAERRRFPVRGSLDLGITSYGVAGSFNVTPQFAVGAGLAIYDFQMDSLTERFLFVSQIPAFYEPPNFAPTNRANFQEQTGDSTGVGVNIGALWAPTRVFQLGAVYRQGPDFDILVRNINPQTNQPFENGVQEGRFHVPHVFGVGVLFRPFTNGTVTVDISRVGHSRLTEDFVDIFEEPDEDPFYSIDDATEFHAGFEYVITRGIPIALRGGYWMEPEHALTYSGPNQGRSEVFRPLGEDQHHITAGAGAVFGRFEVNGAVDSASRATMFSVSAVVRF